MESLERYMNKKPLLDDAGENIIEGEAGI